MDAMPWIAGTAVGAFAGWAWVGVRAARALLRDGRRSRVHEVGDARLAIACAALLGPAAWILVWERRGMRR